MLSADALVRQQNWRYATKKFDPARKIPAADWQALERCLVLTPSSFGLQPWRFVVITDPTTKSKLVPFSWNQTQSADCSHFVVFAARTEMTEADIDKLIHRTAETRGATVETLAGYRRLMLGILVPPMPGINIPHWAALQAYIALGNFMTSAAVIGVDTCPMEGIDRAKYDELLGLPAEGYHTVVACAAGYRADDDKYASLAKVRYAAEDVIRHV